MVAIRGGSTSDDGGWWWEADAAGAGGLPTSCTTNPGARKGNRTMEHHPKGSDERDRRHRTAAAGEWTT